MHLNTLATFIVAYITSAGVAASSGARYPSVCGYWLVNNARKILYACTIRFLPANLSSIPIDYTQSQIAQMACGSTVTCAGQEWNTIFHMDLVGQWHAAGFCSTGCDENVVDGLDSARCN